MIDTSLVVVSSFSSNSDNCLGLSTDEDFETFFALADFCATGTGSRAP